MKKICFIALLLAASACATGVFRGGSSQSLPPLEPGKGRVLIYRGSATGSPYVPEVLLNGERVGRLDRPGVIFRDVPPGSYAVTSTNISRVANFSVAAGERKYIRFANGFFEQYMHPDMVEPARGESEAAALPIVVQGRK